MSTLLKPIKIRETLLERRLMMFSFQEFERLFPLAKYKLKYFLEKESKDGIFIRLKKNLYCLKTDLPSEEIIANKLYRPSYISFEYALAKYNILPEMPYIITSASSKPTREFHVLDKTFQYLSIKKEAYTGYYLDKSNNGGILIAEAEKALCDYLYFTTLGKKPFNDRLNIVNLNKDKIKTYAYLFKRKSLTVLIKKIC